MPVSHAQQIELIEVLNDYMASTRYYAQRIAEPSTNDIMRNVYKQAMESDRIGYFNATDSIHKNGAKYRYFRRFGAIFRLFLQEDNMSYLEDIKAKSHVIVVHTIDLMFYEEIR